MSPGERWQDDYVPVNDRLRAFYEKYPDGSIQSEIVEYTDSRVTIRAYAYRSPSDPRPGIGLSALGIPGTTGFTLGSEIENAETSAWGRAIASLGFEVKRGVASAEEVRNAPTNAGRTALRAAIVTAASQRGIDPDGLAAIARDAGVTGTATIPQLKRILSRLQEESPDDPGQHEAADEIPY